MEKKYNFTESELKAYKIMTQQELITTDMLVQDIHEKANELILLAEKIKAERAIIAMNL